MINTNFSKIQNVLYLLVLVFPFVILLKSAAINITLVIITIISILLIVKKKNHFFFKDNFIKLIILFIGYIFINAMYNFHNIETVIKSFANYRYLFLTFAVFITLESISKKNFFIFIYLNLILIILIGLDIFYQYNFGKNIFGFLPGMCDSNLQNCVRFSGVFGAELIAGGYISQIGLLILFLLNAEKILKKNISKQIIFYLFLFFILSTILLTGERNALLIFLISVFFFYFFQKKIKIINFLAIASIFFVMLYIVGLSSKSIKSRYIDFYMLSKNNFQQEISFIEIIKNNPWSFHYRAAYELFLQKPVFGHGYKSFRYKCSDTKIDKLTIEKSHIYKDYRACSTHPHSYVMEFLSENGIIGFLFFMTFFIMIFYKILNLKINSESNNLIAFGVGSLILAVIFPIKPSGSFFTTFNASILFYLLGFFLHFIKRTK